MVEGLRAVQLSGPRRERAPEGPLTGRVVVVTGSIEGYSRSIREHLEELGEGDRLGLEEDHDGGG